MSGGSGVDNDPRVLLLAIELAELNNAMTSSIPGSDRFSRLLISASSRSVPRSAIA